MKFSIRSRHATQIALLAALTGFVFFAGSSWYASWSDSSDRLASATANIGRINWIVGHQAQIEQKLQQRKADLAAYRLTYIQADSQDHAAAELQKRIKQAISDAGGSISSAQPISFQSDRKEKTAAARFRVAIPSAKLGDFLYELEMQLPLLFIDHAEIVRSNPAVGDSGATSFLTVQFDAHSYWWDGKSAN